MLYLIFVLLLSTLIGGTVLVLTIQNLATHVEVGLLIWQTPSIPLGILFLASFILGALVLYIASGLGAWRDHRELKKLRRRVKELETQSSAADVPNAAFTPAQPLSMPGTSGPIH